MYLANTRALACHHLRPQPVAHPLSHSNSSLKEIFPTSYPYAQEGSELATLIQLIESGRHLPLDKYAARFSWQLFAAEFVKITKYAKK